jgi:hypothetical protein
MSFWKNRANKAALSLLGGLLIAGGGVSAQVASTVAFPIEVPSISASKNAIAGYPLALDLWAAVPHAAYDRRDLMIPGAAWMAVTSGGKIQLSPQGTMVRNQSGGQICGIACAPFDVPSGAWLAQAYFNLGPFPAGTYSIEMLNLSNSIGAPQLSTNLVVEHPPARINTPWIDYSDHWWNPQESGWGMMVWHDKNRNGFMAAWFGYDVEGKPYWFTLQGGSWERRVYGAAIGFRYSGLVIESSGPNFTDVNYPATTVTGRSIGAGSIDFTDANNATLNFTIDGVATRTTRITRFNP